MKNIGTVILIPVLLLLTNCGKDEGPEPQPEQNRPPSSFTLLSPENGAEDEPRTPTLSWEKALDPDGDEVTYDLYLGKQGEPTSLLAEALTVNSFTSIDTLDFDQEYQWKVVAKDAKGASTGSPVKSFFVQPLPIEFLRRHAIDTADKYFEYADDGYLKELEDINQRTWALSYNTSTEKLERSYRDIQSAFLYGYSKEGMQKTVGEISVGGAESWKLEHKSAFGALTKIYHLIQRGAITELAEAVSFVYEYRADIDGGFMPKLVQIQIGSVTDNGTISKKIDLEWIGENIGKITVELDSTDGLVFSEQFEYEYDNNVNPYYTIIREQFGFDAFYLTNFETGLETIDFGPFYWQSKNNITKMMKTEQGTNGRFVTNRTYDYTYSKDYYPIFARVAYFNDTTSMQWTEEWNY